MHLDDVTAMIRRGWWIVLVLAGLGAHEGHAYAAGKPVVYTSTSQAYVVVNNSGTSGGDTFNAGQAAQDRMASYTALATSPVVTQGVIDALQIPLTQQQVAGRLRVTFAPGTVVLNITAGGSLPSEASVLAAETMRQLVKQVELLETPAPGVPPWARAVPVVESTPVSVVNPPTGKLTAGGALGGAALGSALAFLLVRLAPRARSRASLAAAFGVEPASADDPRAVRSRILENRSDSKLIAVSGIRADSWPTAKHVADAFAATGASVLVVDARPELAGASAEHALANSSGLAELLRGETEATEPPPGPGSVAVLPSGIGRADLPDLLSSPGAAAVFARLSDGYDRVLVDGLRPETSVSVRESTRLYVVRPGEASIAGYRREAGVGHASDGPIVVAALRPTTATRRWAARALGLVRQSRGR